MDLRYSEGAIFRRPKAGTTAQLEGKQARSKSHRTAGTMLPKSARTRMARPNRLLIERNGAIPRHEFRRARLEHASDHGRCKSTSSQVATQSKLEY